MDVLGWVAAQGGVVRTTDLRRAGASEYRVREHVASGQLMRPRGGWVALPYADPALIAAARAGVILTCVTLAARLGLWVLRDGAEHHVAAAKHSGSVTARGAHVHWAAPIVPRLPGSLTDAAENMLALIASCQPYERALATWESAIKAGMVDLPQLRRLPFTGAARDILRVATPFSDSGLETFVLVRLRWLHLVIVPQAWIAGHKVDFLIGDRLVLQIDGAHHVGEQRAQDIAHDALLTTLGYHVIRVGYIQVIDRWHEVQRLVMHAVAQGLHLAR
jgi:very-short-patch-repair endonuclease